jgi:hypothetical protein
MTSVRAGAMFSLDDIRRLLEQGSRDPAYLDAAIAQGERLKTLAYDLDFFVRNPEWRAADPSYYGPEEAG